MTIALLSSFHKFPAVPPTITGGDEGPTEKKVVLTKNLILECEATGHPPPSLTWLKDGFPVRHGDGVHVLEQGRKIEILSATISDSGLYICVATSIAGEKEVKYDVRVLGTNIQNTLILTQTAIKSSCKAFTPSSDVPTVTLILLDLFPHILKAVHKHYPT